MLQRLKLKKKKREKGAEDRGENEKDGKQELEASSSSSPLVTPAAMASAAPTYKVILCGEYGVGKSSIFRLFLANTSSSSNSSSNTTSSLTAKGQDQHTRPFTVGSTPVQLTMWDTGGMERMSFIGASYYRGANAALLVYNSNNADTFSILSQYILDIAMNAEGAKIFLCGNEADDGEGKEKVQEADMDAFMSKCGDLLSGVYSVSCKDNRGLEPMFLDIAQVLHKDALQRHTLPRDMLRPEEPVKLEPEPETSSKCC